MRDSPCLPMCVEQLQQSHRLFLVGGYAVYDACGGVSCGSAARGLSSKPCQGSMPAGGMASLHSFFAVHFYREGSSFPFEVLQPELKSQCARLGQQAKWAGCHQPVSHGTVGPWGPPVYGGSNP